MITKNLQEAQSKLELLSKAGVSDKDYNVACDGLVMGDHIVNMGYVFDYIQFRGKEIGDYSAISECIDKYMTNKDIAGMVVFIMNSELSNHFTLTQEESSNINKDYHKKMEQITPQQTS